MLRYIEKSFICLYWLYIQQSKFTSFIGFSMYKHFLKIKMILILSGLCLSFFSSSLSPSVSLNPLPQIFNIIVNKKDHRRHLYLVSNLRGERAQYFTLSVMLAIRNFFLIDTLHQIISFYSQFVQFYHEQILNFSRCFWGFIEMTFSPLYSVNGVNYIG